MSVGLAMRAPSPLGARTASRVGKSRRSRSTCSSATRACAIRACCCRRTSAFLARPLLADHRAQRRLVELAHARHRKSVDRLEALGQLELGESFMLEEGAE